MTYQTRNGKRVVDDDVICPFWPWCSDGCGSICKWADHIRAGDYYIKWEATREHARA